jgi:phage baseplate assembly protein W
MLKRVTPGLTDKSLVTGKKIEFKDIDLTFAARPGSVNTSGQRQGDVYKKNDVNAVIQAVETILLTNTQEKPFYPSFGANIRASLFDMVESYSERVLREQVIAALERDEPRVVVKDVQFYDGEKMVRKGVASAFERGSLSNTIALVIIFTVENQEGEFTARVNMNRLR